MKNVESRETSLMRTPLFIYFNTFILKLRSLSFILVMSGISFALLTALYLLIDIFDIYSGTPFLYLGRNSITIYICHMIFQDRFPNFKVPDKHPYLLGNNLYCISIWCIVAAMMDYNHFYINI